MQNKSCVVAFFSSGKYEAEVKLSFSDRRICRLNRHKNINKPKKLHESGVIIT